MRLADFWRDAGCCRREQHVDILEKCDDLVVIPAPEFLRLVHISRRYHRAGEQTIAHRRIEIVRPPPQPFQMQRRAFAGRNHISCGACARGFGNLHFACHAECLHDSVHGVLRFRQKDFF